MQKEIAANHCPVCGALTAPRRKFCSPVCYHAAPKSDEFRARMSEIHLGKPKTQAMRNKLSASTTGKPKPWVAGAENPNYGGKAYAAPGVAARHQAAVEARGLAWSPEQRLAHAATMRGPSNAMRGKTHTPEFKAKMSAKKSGQYRAGTVKIKSYKLSRAERDIAEHLAAAGVVYRPQFHVAGVPFLYDFLLPNAGVIVDFHGDYWHANPEKYPAGSVLRQFRIGAVPVESIWERDAARRAAALAHGYGYAVVWECDYRANGMLAFFAAAARAALRRG